MPTAPRRSKSLSIGTFDQRLDPEARCLDLSNLAFVDAYGLVATACALEAALRERRPFSVIPPVSKRARGHLTYMGFRRLLERYDLERELPERPAATASEILVPLQSAEAAGGVEAMSLLLWGQLRDHVSPQVLEALGEGVSEMVANALEHAGADAQVMAQVYKAPLGQPPYHDDRVQVVIGDIGQGIRSSFLSTGALNPKDDREAVEVSLEYLVTSVIDDPGRGQGLWSTMDQTVGLRGTMVVRSGTARVDLGLGRKDWSRVSPIPGVIVALSLPLYP